MSCDAAGTRLPEAALYLNLERIPYGFLGNFNALSRQSPQM
jgi:hypothetical protein